LTDQNQQDDELEREETVEDLDVPGDELDDISGGVRKAGKEQQEY
jgi:hypothetical protein